MIYDLSGLPYADTPPWELTNEQRAERDEFMVRAEAERTERLQREKGTATTLVSQAKSRLSDEAAAWVAANQWVNQRPARFTRTHFRPSVLRRGKIR